jgi:histidinol phosphatase-like PHP family hydrolase
MFRPRQASRRSFLSTTLAVGGVSLAGLRLRADDRPALPPPVDFHTHLDNSTIEAVVALGKERGVSFGIVEHAGTKANIYPKVLSNDAEMSAYLDMLDPYPVYKGIQAEWIDWASCFSKTVLSRLDYVLTDAMTFPGPDGSRIKLWEADALKVVDMTDHQAFMDRFVDWNVQVVETQPMDILANVSWLPAPLMPEYDALWTPARIDRVVQAMKRQTVACEISASYELPHEAFLLAARDAGLKFTFGSNGRYPKMGLLDYSRQMADRLGIGPDQMFRPAPDGHKAVQRRL